jgi:murein DD-endopeptidase MepM/ murein hydrolase activator NlpD
MRARATRPAAAWLVGAAGAGFLAGALLTSAPRPAPVMPRQLLRPSGATNADAPVLAPPPVSTPTIGADPLEELRKRHLALPLPDVERHDLRDTFDEMRGGTRRHEALDIVAPRNTPVLAVEDGTVAKLFLSKAGGLTLYQFDPTRTYAYYYAHLERYADGVKEGDRVERGQVIGYVGTSGNAPPDAPHLHFAIFKLTDAKRWWQGTAIDPYPVLSR